MANKNNSGVLFKNERKSNDKQPDYTGMAVVNDVELRLSAWLNTSSTGKKYLSLAFSEPKAKEETQEQSPEQVPAPDDDFGNDEIPF
jgi:uncharacterized protein (DUF736 family)